MKNLIDKIKETFKKYCTEDVKETWETHFSMKNEISKEENSESVKKHLIQQVSGNISRFYIIFVLNN